MSAVNRWFIAAALAIGTMACAKLGYSDRVLWRLSSPDGKWVAVCQEIPEFDGPSYDIRLERPDGTVIKQLYQIGDGDPCSELAWSPDSQRIAILSGHVARVRFVDIAFALDQGTATRYWSWPQIDVGSEQTHRNASGLRFTGPREIELQLCGARPYTPGDAGRRVCGTDAETRRIGVPDLPRSAR